MLFWTILTGNSQLALQFLNEPVLGVALVVNEGAHLPTYQAISVHGMDVLNLLGTSNHRFDLGQQYTLLEMGHASRIVDNCPKKPMKASRDLGQHTDAIQVQNEKVGHLHTW